MLRRKTDKSKSETNNRVNRQPSMDEESSMSREQLQGIRYLEVENMQIEDYRQYKVPAQRIRGTDGLIANGFLC